LHCCPQIPAHCSPIPGASVMLGAIDRSLGMSAPPAERSTFFRGYASIWGDTPDQPPSLADLQRELSFAIGPNDSFSPQPRWKRVSSSSSARMAAPVETPPPRQKVARSASPPKLDLPPATARIASPGLPRLLCASTGPPIINPKRAASTSPPRSSVAASRLMVPMPAWASSSPKRPLLAGSVSPRRPVLEEVPAVSPRRYAKRSLPTSPVRTNTTLASVAAARPVTSFGELLQQQSETALVVQPLKKTRIGAWAAQMRGTALVEVPIKHPASDSDGRPRRFRMKPLEFWRGERVILERLPGSAMPSLKSVVLNCAAQYKDVPELTVPPEAVPVVADGQQAEYLCTKTPSLTSKLIVLPAWNAGINPPSFSLPPFSVGHVFVIEGSLRFAEADPVPVPDNCETCGVMPGRPVPQFQDKAILNKGDHLMLPGGERHVLLGSAGPRKRSPRVVFKVFLITVDPPKDPDVAALEQL